MAFRYSRVADFLRFWSSGIGVDSLDAAVGAVVSGPEAVVDEIKPAFTNEANKFCKLAEIAGGSAAGVGAEGPGTNTGFETAGGCE